MITCKLVTIGNSLGVCIPAPYRRKLGVLKGEYLQVEMEGETVTIRSNSAKQTTFSNRSSRSGAGGIVKRNVRRGSL